MEVLIIHLTIYLLQAKQSIFKYDESIGIIAGESSASVEIINATNGSHPNPLGTETMLKIWSPTTALHTM